MTFTPYLAPCAGDGPTTRPGRVICGSINPDKADHWMVTPAVVHAAALLLNFGNLSQSQETEFLDDLGLEWGEAAMGGAFLQPRAKHLVPSPALLLNKHQAEAIYSAMCALNNVYARIDCFIEKNAIHTREMPDGTIVIHRAPPKSLGEPMMETHVDQAAFQTAYGLA